MKLILCLILFGTSFLSAQITLEVHPAFATTEKGKDMFFEGINILLDPQFQHNALLGIAEETGIAAKSIDSILEVTIDPYKKTVRVEERRESNERLDKLFATEFFRTTQFAHIHDRMVRIENTRKEIENLKKRIESPKTTEATRTILKRRFVEIEQSIIEMKSKVSLGPDPWRLVTSADQSK